MPGLGASFGRGAATNYQQDLANSDCILFMGSNMAEAHPVGFRWPMKAKARGATLIHVDPRYTRTSALCDVHVSIRAGSDLAFLGGLVNYVLSHDRWFKDYVLNYTNASAIVHEAYQDTEDLGGLFSGYHGNGKTGTYDAREGGWRYCRTPEEGGAGGSARRRCIGCFSSSACTGTPSSREAPATPGRDRRCRVSRKASRPAILPCNTLAASFRS